MFYQFRRHHATRPTSRSVVRPDARPVFTNNNNNNKMFQRLSMLIQRFNSALITDSFCFAVIFAFSL